MITNFKIFENNKDKPQLGDYVKIKTNFWKRDFFEKNFGKIIEIKPITHKFQYIIKFDKKTGQFSEDNTIAFELEDFEAWASDKESLKIKINAKKYNI